MGGTSMEHLEHMHISDVPQLEGALLIAAFSGWNDAASAATWAVKYLVSQWDAQSFAELDPEPFYDFTESRPHVKITGGSVRLFSWPSDRFYAIPRQGQSERATRDIVLLLGEEPQMRWRTFSEEIVALCERCNVTEIALLGSLVAEVPHTAPVQISGTVSRAAHLKKFERCGIERASYSGTTGVLSAIQDAAKQHGIQTTSLWGVAPHYISAAPNLAVSEALLRKLDSYHELGLELRELSRAARRFTARVSSLVAEDPDVSAYVHELESRTTDDLTGSDEWEAPWAASFPGRRRDEEGELPSAEQAIRSAEDLLRQFREGSSSE